MKYDFIISDMVWSYSRLTAYDTCKYAWLLRYIKNEGKRDNFFSQYGTFAHNMIRKYLSGEIARDELPEFYAGNFDKHVTKKAPNEKIYENYYRQGAEYADEINLPERRVLGIEQEMRFKLDGYDFICFVDLITEEDGVIYITDHKSKDIKERAERDLKSNGELDEQLRQLYIYCIPVNEKYNRYPEWLEFNCFRTKTYIREKFDLKKLEETKKWAAAKISEITENENWETNYNQWYCCNLCDVKDKCYAMELNAPHKTVNL